MGKLIDLDSAIEALNALPEASAASPDVAALQAALDQANADNAELEKKNNEAQASLAAEISKEVDLQAQKDLVDAKVQKALADLQGA